jgi:hypothetical protein
MKRNLVITAVIIAVLFALGIRFTHPSDGLTSAMGSAQSGVVIYKGADEVKKGDKVVFQLKDSEFPDSVYLGIVMTSDANGVGVDAKNVVTQINPEDVKSSIKGKMIVIVPFFGKILGIVGL